MAFPPDWRSGPGQPTFQPFFVATVEVLGRAMQAGWLISVSCTLHFPLQLQFPSLLRSRSDRSHAMLPRPHAGEHCVTPVRAAAKETNSYPGQSKLLFVCKNSIVLFSFLFWSLVSVYCFLFPDLRFLYSIFVLLSLISLSTFFFLFSGFLFPFSLHITSTISQKHPK